MESQNHHQLHHQQQQQPEEHRVQQKNQEKQQEKDEHKHGEEVAENERNSPTVSQFPLTQKTTQSPPSDHSHVDSPLSSYNSSLSHGFSPPPPTSSSQPSKPPPPPPAAAVSRAELTSRDLPTATTFELEEQIQKLGSGSGKGLRCDLSILRRAKRDKVIKKALLGFRISGFVFCLVSFSILAADKNQGWALDSFYRYKEFRFCMAVNVIGFVYSGIQAYDLAYQLASRKPRSYLRRYIDFASDQDVKPYFSNSEVRVGYEYVFERVYLMQILKTMSNSCNTDFKMPHSKADKILAYLLISASSSAAVRVDDWQSNWGKDKFPEMARASMALSLVAFVALALSSLVSGYHLCTVKSM